MITEGKTMIDKGQTLLKGAGAPTAGAGTWLASKMDILTPDSIVIWLTIIWLLVQIFTKLWDWSKTLRKGKDTC
jgi:hypothetical protein